MAFSTGDIKGFPLFATDGEIGSVSDVYFDDEHWVVRHLVVDTGGWLSGRKVLISPHSVKAVDVEHGKLDVTLTRDRISNAPDIDTSKPVSRQQEIPYYDYYGYPYYWAGAGVWGAGAFPVAGAALPIPPRDAVAREVEARRQEEEREASDPHLRSSAEVIGYDISATDGNIGHVEDFLIDGRSWAIRYALVDTRNWLPGRLVLISPRWIQRVDWSGREVHVNLTRDAVKSSPPYGGKASAFSQADEEALHRHYGYPPEGSAT